MPIFVLEGPQPRDLLFRAYKVCMNEMSKMFITTVSVDTRQNTIGNVSKIFVSLDSVFCVINLSDRNPTITTR